MSLNIDMSYFDLTIPRTDIYLVKVGANLKCWRLVGAGMVNLVGLNIISQQKNKQIFPLCLYLELDQMLGHLVLVMLWVGLDLDIMQFKDVFHQILSYLGLNMRLVVGWSRGGVSHDVS